MPQQHKAELRKIFREIRHAVKDKEAKNKLIEKALLGTPQFKKAHKILFYFSLDEEVQTTSIIKKYLNKKFIVLPRIEKQSLKMHHISHIDHLHKGNFDIYQPRLDRPVVEASTIELAIIPGLAFDKKGNRLGFGKGLYDRLLKNLKCPKIALAYDEQIAKDIPSEDHDEKVNIVITDKQIIN